jgi:hypothetical protein
MFHSQIWIFFIFKGLAAYPISDQIQKMPLQRPQGDDEFLPALPHSNSPCAPVPYMMQSAVHRCILIIPIAVCRKIGRVLWGVHPMADDDRFNGY